MRRQAIGGCAAVAVLVLTGCTGQDQGAAPTPGPGTTPPAATVSPSGPATPDLDRYTPPPSGLVDEDSGETIEPREVPTWDDASRGEVVEAAETALRAFAKPGTSHEQWWSDLEPLLTPQAAEDYAYVDPANVPATEVTGAGELVEESSAYLGTVEVPTDAGPYTLILNRRDAGSPWLVSRITPSEDAN